MSNMKKKTKKIISLMLAMILCIALSVSAFAADAEDATGDTPAQAVEDVVVSDDVTTSENDPADATTADGEAAQADEDVVEIQNEDGGSNKAQKRYYIVTGIFLIIAVALFLIATYRSKKR